MRALLWFALLSPALSMAFDVNTVELGRAEDGRIQSVTLSGSGFGIKESPILYDRVDYAYEKGKVNNFFSSYSDGQLIDGAVLRSASNSVWQSVGAETFIVRNSENRRHPESLAHYYGASGKSNLHNPRIWPRSGTPSDESKLYVSWWFRQKNDTRWYFQHVLSDVSSNFNPIEGDAFSVDVGPHWSGLTTVQGRVVHYDRNTKILHAVYYGQPNNNRIGGRFIELAKGGEAKLSALHQPQGSNKFIRVWDSDGSDGTFRLSWTNLQLTLAGGIVAWPASDVGEEKWSHMEIFIDKDEKSIKTYINRNMNYFGHYTTDLGKVGHSPTIGLIGFDASINLFQEIWLDDIYLDSSFRRIVLGDAPIHRDVIHEEVQYYTQWQDNEIKFNVRLGGLDRRNPAYIYVYGEDGTVINQQGIPFQSRPVMSH